MVAEIVEVTFYAFDQLASRLVLPGADAMGMVNAFRQAEWALDLNGDDWAVLSAPCLPEQARQGERVWLVATLFRFDDGIVRAGSDG